MLERYLRGIAGGIILLCVILGMMFDIDHLEWIIILVGLNLFQSAFTNWCPMMALLKKLGVK